MADYDLGTAHGRVVIDSDNRGVAKTNAELQGLKRNSEVAGGGMRKLSTGMLVAGAAIAVGIGAAVKSAVSFEQRLSGIKAVSGATTTQMEQVRAKALQLGKDTKFSAGEAAQAIEELSKAGVSLPDILNGAADATVALAAAGEVSLPRAAEIAANAMNVFSLKASDMPKVADLIAGAANASAIDVDQFAQSLAQSGAAAALVGVSFDDLAVAIAEMGNAGIKGSDAGTSLKTFLQNLQPDTKKQTTLFKQLGLITEDGGNKFFDASGKVKSLSDVAQVLQNSLKGMTQQQKQAALNTLFGSDAIRAAAIISKGGAKGFDDLAKSMGKVTAADVAKTRMDNLAGSVEQLKGSLETAGIVIGTIILPALRSIVDGVTGALNAFLSLSPGAQSAALNIAGAAAAFLIVGGVALKLITILRDLKIALATTWATALGPIALVIVAILAVGAAVFILYQRFQPVRDVVNAVGNAIKTAFLAVLPVIMTIVAGVQAFIAVLQGASAGGSGFVGFMSQLGAVVRDVVIPALIAVGQFLLTTFGPIFTQVRSIITGFVTAIIGYFQSIAPQLAAIGNAIRAVWNFIWPPLLAVIKVIFPLIVGFITSTLQLLAIGIRVTLAGIANIFRGVFNIIGGIIKVFLSILTGNWSGAWNGIKQIVTGVLQTIKGVVQAVIGIALVGIAVSALGKIKGVFTAGWNAIRGVVTGTMGAIRAVVSGGIAAVRSIVSGGVAAVRGVFSGLSAVQGVVSGIFGRVVSIIGGALGRAVGVVSGGLGRVIGAISGIAGRAFSAGAQIVSSLIGGLTSKLGGLISIAQKVAGVIAKVIPGSPVREGPLKVLNRGYAGGQIIKMLVDGIQRQESVARSTMRNVVGGMSGELDRLATTQAIGVMANLGVAGAASAASRPATGVRPATTTSGASAGAPGTDAIAAAVLRGLTDARFEFGPDGLAKIVAGSLVPSFAIGARA